MADINDASNNAGNFVNPDAGADGYYGDDDATNEEIDLNFLDEDKK